MQRRIIQPSPKEAMGKRIQAFGLLAFTTLLMMLPLETLAEPEESGIALFVFGDSCVDVGTNNYISTTTTFQADYPPYGNNGFFENPTGRFCDGKIIVDFIAEYAGLPLIPPFLEPHADFTRGVNFASGGAGVLPDTNEGYTVSLQKQLQQFEEVQTSVAENLGSVKADRLFSEAVYFISIGSNDYLGGYLGNPVMQKLYSPEEYVGIVVSNLTNAIQILYSKGARKFANLGLSPLGCLPIMRAMANDPNRGCLEVASALSRAHNDAVSMAFKGLSSLLPTFKFVDSNFYNFLDDRMNHPSLYGFKDGVKACCGSGSYGGIYSCGGKREVIEYELCEDSKEHIWWDSYHPTEHIHQQFAEAMWAGPNEIIHPTNLSKLFQHDQLTTIGDTIDGVQDINTMDVGFSET